MRYLMRGWDVVLGGLLVVGCAEDSPDATASAEETTMLAASSDDGTSDTSGSTIATDPGTTDGDTSSSDAPADSSGAVDSSGAADSGSTGATLSFEGDVWPLLVLERDPPLSGTTTSCNGCHGAGAGGLVLPDVATAYVNLLDMPSSSTLCADMPLVTAGDPDGSCFVVFYEMRLRDQLGWVEQAETDLVRAWVESGAAP